ncbi:MAG: hypothetical protein AAGI34_03835 [Pseudomonadota bacterium]
MRVAQFIRIGAVLALVAVAGCGNTTANRALVGAGIGAVVGLGIAGANGADPGASALVGAAGGAALGAATTPRFRGKRYSRRGYYKRPRYYRY